MKWEWVGFLIENILNDVMQVICRHKIVFPYFSYPNYFLKWLILSISRVVLGLFYVKMSHIVFPINCLPDKTTDNDVYTFNCMCDILIQNARHNFSFVRHNISFVRLNLCNLYLLVYIYAVPIFISCLRFLFIRLSISFVRLYIW